MERDDTLLPLTGADTDYDPLVERTVQSRFVLIGEASHGTHEFYGERAEITKRLIAAIHRSCRRGRLARRLPRQPLRAR